MKLYLITFCSKTHKGSTLRNAHVDLLSELEQRYEVELTDWREMDKLGPEAFKLVFIADNSVEKLVAQCYEKLPRPVFLLSDGALNSLSSCLEIASWLRRHGIKTEILHSDIPSIAKRIDMLYHCFCAQRALNGKRIGMIGLPSPWLLDSNVDYLLAKRRWGVEYNDVNMEKLHLLYERITIGEVDGLCATVASMAMALRDIRYEDLINEVRLYKALSLLCLEEGFSAITVNKEQLYERMKISGCLAMSLLNDEGICAGCEGDAQAIFTLLMINTLTGKGGFISKPSLTSNYGNEVVLTQCTVGLRQTERYILRTDIDNDMGIGVQGFLPQGVVTVLKCGGECLDEYYVDSGRIMENTNYINLCRTQVKVKLNHGTDYFLNNSIGNHHILVQGNHSELVNDFLQQNSCKRRF